MATERDLFSFQFPVHSIVLLRRDTHSGAEFLATGIRGRGGGPGVAEVLYSPFLPRSHDALASEGSLGPG